VYQATSDCFALQRHEKVDHIDGLQYSTLAVRNTDVARRSLPCRSQRYRHGAATLVSGDVHAGGLERQNPGVHDSFARWLFLFPLRLNPELLTINVAFVVVWHVRSNGPYSGSDGSFLVAEPDPTSLSKSRAVQRRFAQKMNAAGRSVKH